MGEKVTGVTAALAAHVDGAPLDPEAEQMELVPMAQLPLLGDVMRNGKPVSAGRPKGSQNKSTKELANYVLSRHRHPVIAAAQICDMPLADLKAALNCDMLEAAKYQQNLREFVAKYTLQAMPQSVQVDMGTVGMLMVVNQNAPRPGQDQVNAWGLDLKAIEQNQQLSTDQDGQSHDGKSHETE